MKLTADDLQCASAFLAALEAATADTGVRLQHYEGVQLTVGDGNVLRLHTRGAEQIEYYVTED